MTSSQNNLFYGPSSVQVCLVTSPYKYYYTLFCLQSFIESISPPTNVIGKFSTLTLSVFPPYPFVKNLLDLRLRHISEIEISVNEMFFKYLLTCGQSMLSRNGILGCLYLNTSRNRLHLVTEKWNLNDAKCIIERSKYGIMFLRHTTSNNKIITSKISNGKYIGIFEKELYHISKSKSKPHVQSPFNSIQPSYVKKYIYTDDYKPINEFDDVVPKPIIDIEYLTEEKQKIEKSKQIELSNSKVSSNKQELKNDEGVKLLPIGYNKTEYIKYLSEGIQDDDYTTTYPIEPNNTEQSNVEQIPNDGKCSLELSIQPSDYSMTIGMNLEKRHIIKSIGINDLAEHCFVNTTINGNVMEVIGSGAYNFCTAFTALSNDVIVEEIELDETPIICSALVSVLNSIDAQCFAWYFGEIELLFGSRNGGVEYMKKDVENLFDEECNEIITFTSTDIENITINKDKIQSLLENVKLFLVNEEEMNEVVDICKRDFHLFSASIAGLKYTEKYYIVCFDNDDFDILNKKVSFDFLQCQV
ncbi:Uncharacterized protein QTN25_002403 [Entamoeba marina]